MALIFQFEKMKDIEDILKKQWSGYFQRLLSEQRHRTDEQKRIDILSEQFNDLKTALLSSIENVDQRRIAKGIVNYRRMLELFLALKIPRNYLVSSKENFQEVLEHVGIVDVVDYRKIGLAESFMSPKVFFIKSDDTFFECRINYSAMNEINNDWEEFKKEAKNSKEIIYDTISEMYYPKMSYCRYRNELFGDYVNRFYERILPDSDKE